MAKLNWDLTSEHYFETGVDHGVLYVDTAAVVSANIETWAGYAWNGLTGVTESPSGAENTDLWADNIKYLTLTSAEEFAATLTCYTYPDEWMYCDGSLQPTDGVTVYQQPRRKFGLSYRTKIGNDVAGNDLAYKLHIIYGCSATPSERAYSTVNDSPEAIEFSYEIATIPVPVNDNTPNETEITGYNPTALVTIDSRQYTDTTKKAKLTTLENIIYGSGTTAGTDDAHLVKPATIIRTLAA